MHNLGYQHNGNQTGNYRRDNVPHVYSEKMMSLYNTPEVMQKYATQIKKMKAFYLKKYQSVITAPILSMRDGLAIGA